MPIQLSSEIRGLCMLDEKFQRNASKFVVMGRARALEVELEPDLSLGPSEKVEPEPALTSL